MRRPTSVLRCLLLGGSVIAACDGTNVAQPGVDASMPSSDVGVGGTSGRGGNGTGGADAGGGTGGGGTGGASTGGAGTGGGGTGGAGTGGVSTGGAGTGGGGGAAGRGGFSGASGSPGDANAEGDAVALPDAEAGAADGSAADAVASDAPVVFGDCTLDAGQCPSGYECACGGPGPVGQCQCHKRCQSEADCSAPHAMCGCSDAGPAARLCVSSCFCFCG